MADEVTEKGAPEREAPSTGEEPDTRNRLAEARLEEAMRGYRLLQAENETLRAQVADLLERQRAATQDLGASLERQKRAVARELKTERETIYTRYIEILDNFDRAFDTLEARAASHSLMEGFILVRNQVVQVLRDGGFDRVRTIGLAYDPNTSEAMEMEPVDDPAQDGIVIREHLRGYRLDDQVVRAARVVVGRYTPKAPPEDSGETVRFEDSGETKRVDDSGETLRIPEDGDEVAPVDGSQGEKK